VFIGHVDAGKSTMGGQLLALTGMVDRRTLEKYQKEAKEMGRESWYLSWALDSDTKERAKGKTVEVGRAYFETDVRRYTVLDAPGHKTYIPSMITGSSQADLAALVISARKGEFETGFEKGGQTREHALLVKSNGINKLVVVINKMDDPTVAWDKARYDEIVEKLTLFLKSVGYNPKTDITFIPVSAFTGANMKERLDPKVASWYSGPALLEYLDNMPIDDRKYNEAFMFPVSEKYNELGAIAVGKIESGRVKKGDTVLLMPNRERIEVGAIYDEQGAELDGALCGDNVRIRLKNVNEDGLQPGFVLTSPIRPVQVARRFEAQVAILDSKNIMAAGFACIMHLHTLSEEITFVQLLNYYDKKTGRKSRKPPAFAKKGMKVLVLIETTAPICVETFANQPSLGRFTLRDEGKTIGIGKVTKIRDRADMPSIEELNIKDTPEAAA
jgi:peptide chain release factor subunit 3